MAGTLRRRLLWIGGGVTTLVVVAALAVTFFFRDTATPVTQDEVVATLPGAGGGNPGDDGVYSYETVGFEEVDALGGGRHDFPAETFLTLRSEGCGTAVRWQALKERWDEDLICDDGRIQYVHTFHEWFGVEDLTQYECPEEAHAYPRNGETTWSFVCSTGDTFEEYTYEVIGTEELVIGGQPTVTLHLRIVSTVTGQTVGDSEIHDWVVPGTDLIVKRTVRGDNTTESRIGGVTYHEEFEVILRSLTPVGGSSEQLGDPGDE
jgi:hypothetical protein